MEFARPIMWNVPRAAEIALYVLVPLVAAAFLAGAVWRVRKWFLGQAEPGTPAPGRQLAWALQPKRLGELVQTALFQRRLAPDGFSLVMHQAMFWGMVFLGIGTVLAAIDQDVSSLLYGRQFLSGRFYLLFEFVLDVFGVVLIVGVAMAACRRYVLRPARLQAKRTVISLWDGFPFLTLLGLIAVTGFLVEGLRIAEGFSIENEVAAAVADRASKRDVIARLDLHERLYKGSPRQAAELTRIADGGAVFPAGAAAPVGHALANAFASFPLDSIRLAHQLLWWNHALLAFGLIVGIPFTKAFHFISSPANLLFRHPEPAGRLPVVIEAGVRSVRDYTWRQLLQVDACTWCGKCQDVCPAYQAGLGLSPRDFVQSVGARLLRTRRTDDDRSFDLHGAVIPAAELWACCTCRACEDVCPVQVQHPRLIIDMRRHLVDQGQIDEGLQAALTNVQRYGNSFGQPARKRTDWTKALGFPLKDARREQVDYLWFVGDFASYDPRAQRATQAIAKVLQRAGVDVGLLMETEQNSGNDIRRIGEEGLFALLRDKNGGQLTRAKFRRVLTSDPHAFNTLKNEYRDYGYGGAQEAGAALAGKAVVHYTQLLDELIRAGRLRPARPLNRTVTYHDPCYLGRYNGVYDAPRRVLQALGAHLTEMPRNRRNSFCCGAGGGRLWMQDAPGIVQRPAENRIEEALALPGVQCLVVACPKDLMMFHDAVQGRGATERLRVADIGELVCESLD